MIFMGSGSKTTREARFLPADQPAGTFKIVLPRQDGHDYAVDHYQGQFYITTNKDAKKSRRGSLRRSMTLRKRTGSRSLRTIPK